MPHQTLNRSDIVNALYREVGLSKTESGEIFGSMLNHIANRLIAGETVKLSGFGTFSVREKPRRPGRNPKTGEPAIIKARRVMVFKPSGAFRQRVEAGHKGKS